MGVVVLGLGLLVGGLLAACGRGGRYWRPARAAAAGATVLLAGVVTLPMSRIGAAGCFAVALGFAAYRETPRRRQRGVPDVPAVTAASRP
ncbi:hypothetical protein [Jatrophihabitans fulvus]